MIINKPNHSQRNIKIAKNISYYTKYKKILASERSENFLLSVEVGVNSLFSIVFTSDNCNFKNAFYLNRKMIKDTLL